MKTKEKISDNTHRSDRQWDNLRTTVNFTGKKDLIDSHLSDESSNNAISAENSNEAIINKFSEKEYERVLTNKELLTNLGQNYLEQYQTNNKSNAERLAFKESLDQYILKKAKDDASFTESEEFKNYARYIGAIANSKRFKSSKGDVFYPELATNPVFRDNRLRDYVLNWGFPDTKLSLKDLIDRANKQIGNYQRELGDIAKKMGERARVSQEQLDFVGDYLYQSKDFDSGLGKRFAEYLFNEIRPDDNLRASIPILGAITNYFASQYSLNDEVRKNSRFIISDSEFSTWGIGVSTPYGCVLAPKYYSKLSLTTDKGINKSRTFEKDSNDLYSLMMVSFHELTHDHQRNLAQKGDKSSSAMMFIMKWEILQRGSGCYKGGSSYYENNHDNDETEVEADEEAWRQCREFLAKHQRNYSGDETQRKINQNRLLQCEKNEEEVKGRRSFAHKFTNDFKAVSAIRYDIETLKSTVKKKPELLKTYPQLADYVDPSGKLKLDIFTSSELASGTFANDSPREDTFGYEIGTYIINDNQEFARLAEYISDNGKSFNNAQINNLMLNLENIVHHTIEKARRLDRVNFANYDETQALGKNIPVQKRKTDMMRQYLMQAYKSVLLLDMVKRSHPELSEKIFRQESAHLDGGYYFELSRDKKRDPVSNKTYYELSKDRKLDIAFVKGAIEAYEKTNNPILLNIANQLRNDYGLQ